MHALLQSPGDGAGDGEGEEEGGGGGGEGSGGLGEGGGGGLGSELSGMSGDRCGVRGSGGQKLGRIASVHDSGHEYRSSAMASGEWMPSVPSAHLIRP